MSSTDTNDQFNTSPIPQTPGVGYITAVEAAGRFGFTNDHIALLCRKGKVAGLLVGRVRYVSEESLKQYIVRAEEEKLARRKSLSEQMRRGHEAFVAAPTVMTETPVVVEVVAAMPEPQPITVVESVEVVVPSPVLALPAPTFVIAPALVPLPPVVVLPEPAPLPPVVVIMPAPAPLPPAFVVSEVVEELFDTPVLSPIAVPVRSPFFDITLRPVFATVLALSITAGAAQYAFATPAFGVAKNIFVASVTDMADEQAAGYEWWGGVLHSGATKMPTMAAAARDSLTTSAATVHHVFVATVYQMGDDQAAGYEWWGGALRTAVTTMPRVSLALHTPTLTGSYQAPTAPTPNFKNVVARGTMLGAAITAPKVNSVVASSTGAVSPVPKVVVTASLPTWVQYMPHELAATSYRVWDRTLGTLARNYLVAADKVAEAQALGYEAFGTLVVDTASRVYHSARPTTFSTVAIAQTSAANVWDAWTTWLAAAYPQQATAIAVTQVPAKKVAVTTPTYTFPSAATVRTTIGTAAITTTTVPKTPTVLTVAQGQNYITKQQLADSLNQLENSLRSLIYSQQGSGSQFVPPQIAANGNGVLYGGVPSPVNTINSTTVHIALSASDIPALNYFPATSTIAIGYGGTGTSTAPSYGKLLIGNARGGYDLVGTSSLGITTTNSAASTTLLSDFNTWSAATTTFIGNIGITGNIVPSANNTYSLGSALYQWKDVYVGPGSIFVNGQEVLHTDPSHDVNVTADINQNLIVQTSGTGDVQLNPTGTGVIYLKGNVLFSGGKTFNTSDNSATTFTDGIVGGNVKLSGNTIVANNTNGSIEIDSAGLGAVYVNHGNFGVGTTAPMVKLDVYGDAIISGSNRYLNFGGTTGSSGYGLRDNGGTIEFKNSGGSWTGIGTGGGGGNSFSYLFPNNATTTGLGVFASTTIGDGTQTGGLTISGGATTTGNAYFAGSLGVGVQNTTSGSLQTSGGITAGTSVQTPILFGGTSASASLNIKSTTGNGVTDFIKFTVGNNGGTEAIRIVSSGNVGIGTTSPLTKLQIESGNPGITFTPNARTAAIIDSNNTSGTTLSIIAPISGKAGLFLGSPTNETRGQVTYDNSIDALNFTVGGGAHTFTYSGNGNLGLSSTSPFANLSIHANGGDTSRTLFAIGSSTANSTTTLFSISNTGTTTAVNGFNITAGCYAVNGTCLSTSGGSSASSTLLSDSNIWSGSNLFLASTTIGDGTQTGGLTISGGATTTGNAYFAGSLGVGIASPAAPLHVVGTSFFNNVGNTEINLASAGSNYGKISNNGTGVWSLGYGSSLSSIGTSVLSWNSSGNVGVGTTSPQAILDVSGTGAATDFRLSRTANTNYLSLTAPGGATPTSLLAINGVTVAGFKSTGALAVGGTGYSDSSIAGPANGLIVQGSVGVGTTSPFAQLSVSNSVTTAGNTNLFALASTSNGTATSTVFLVDAKGQVAISSNALTGGGQVVPVSGFSLVTSQNIRIGGVFQTTQAGSATSPILTLSTNTNTGIFFPTTNTLGFTTGGNEAARFSSNGFLGIGTTSPYANLSIVATSTTAGNQTLFAIASSTGGNSTTTLFTIDNVGNTTIAGNLVSVLNQTGGGNVVFSGSPTLSGSLTVPAIRSSSLASGQLFLRGTTNASPTAGSGIIFNYGASAGSEAARITGDTGLVGIGTSSPFAKLAINANPTDTTVTTLFAIGSSTSNSTTTLLSVDNTGALTLSGNAYFASGSASAPSISFSANPTSGIFNNGGAIGIAPFGTTRLTISSTINFSGDLFSSVAGGPEIRNTAGNSATPTPVFVPSRTDLTTGIAAGTIGNINFLVGGNEVARFTNTGFGLGTSSPYAQLALLATSTNGVGAPTALFAIASTTGGTSTSTLFTISNAGAITASALANLSCIGTDSTGKFQSGSCTGGSGTFPFTTTTFGSTNANATSTLIGFNAGIYALASSTIGDGTQTGGLTISGGATTTITDSTISAVTYPLTLGHLTTGTAGNNIGTGIKFQTQNASGASVFSSLIESTLPTVTAGSESAYLTFKNITAGTVQTALTLQTTNALFAGNVTVPGQISLSNGAQQLSWSGRAVLTSPTSAAGVALQIGSATTNQNGFLLAHSIGLGTSTPYAQFALVATSTNGIGAPTTLFTIASTTGGIATTTLFTILNTGNVGINTANPAAPLTIVSSGQGGNTTGFSLLSTTSAQVAAIYDNAQSGGTGVLRLYNNNAVGVQLNANGTSYISSPSFNFGVGTSTPVSSLDVYSNNGDTLIGSTASGFPAIAFGGSSISATNYTLAGQNTGANTYINVPSSSGTIHFRANNAGVGGIADLVTILGSSGNVGIGTTTPGNLFTVSNSNSGMLTYNGSVLSVLAAGGTGTGGGITFTPIASAGAPVLEINAFSGAGVASIDTNSGTLRTLQFYNKAGGGFQTVFAGGTGNNLVGIGTTSPFAPLSIHANSGDTNTTLFAIGSSTASATTTLFSVSNTGATTISNLTPLALVYANASNQLVSAVVGTGLSFSGGSLTLNLSRANTWTGLQQFAAGASTTQLSVYGGAYFGGTATTTIDASGNLGVGTTSPWGQLSVNPNGISGPAFVIGSSTQTLFTVTNAGSVGIGTTNPNEKLTVSGGNIFTSGTLYVAGGTYSFSGSGVLTANTGRFAGTVGIGTSTPYAQLTVWGGTTGNAFEIASNAGSASTTILQVSNAGVVSIGASTLGVPSGIFTVDASSSTTTISNLSVGNLTFDIDAGMVQLSDIPLSSGPAAGTIESQSLSIGGTPTLTVYGENDGSGGAQNLRVSVGTTTPYSRLSVWGSGTGIGQLFELTNNASTTVARFLDNGTGYFAGNIGVGTTSPLAKLSVHANNGDTNTTLFAVASSTTSATTTLFTISNTGTAYVSGSVGVGVQAPTSALDVKGLASDYTGLGILRFNTNSGTNDVGVKIGALTGAGSAGYVFLQGIHTGVANDANIVLNPSAGNVGIGTTSPFAALSVNGSGYFGGNLTATGTLQTVNFLATASSTIGDGTQTGGLTINGGATTTGNAYFAGTAAITGNVQSAGQFISTIVTNNPGFQHYVSNNSRESTLLGNSNSGTGAFYQLSFGNGVSQTASSITLGGSGYTSGNGANSFTINGGGGLWLQSGGVNAIVIPTSGNVGIGTSTPYAQLSITATSTTGVGAPTALFAIASTTGGNSTSTLFSVANNGAITVEAPGGQNWMTFTRAGTQRGFVNSANNLFGIYSAANDFLLGTNNNEVMRITTGNNVGIGSSTPWGQLSINPNGITGPSFVVGSSTATNFVINSAGNVGIGTTSPIANLDVSVIGGVSKGFVVRDTASGNSWFDVGVASAGQVRFNQAGGVTLSAGAASVGRFNIGALSASSNVLSLQGVSGQTGNLFMVDSNSSGTTNNGSQFIITSAGNVGIGSTSPSTTLSVNSNGAGTGISLGNPGNGYAQIFNSSGSLQLLTPNNSIIFGNVGQEYGRFNNSGFFGIGTSTPWGQLSINPNGIIGPAFVIGSSTQTLFTVTNGGNVGIGTSNPSYALDISGTARATVVLAGSASQANFVEMLGANATFNPSIITGGTDTNISLDVYSKGTGTINFNTSGGAQVKIIHTASVANYLTLTGGTSAGTPTLSVDGSGSNVNLNLAPKGSGSVLISSGNFGIATTSPYALLTVGGGNSYPGAQVLFAVASSTNTATTTYLTLDKTGYLAVGAGQGGTDSYGHAVGNSAIFSVDASSSTTTISNLSVGNLTFDLDAGVVNLSDIPLDSNVASGVIQSQSIAIGGTAIFTVYGEADGLGGMQNGRVGIGTTTPYYVLDVASTTGAGAVARFTNATGNCTINPTNSALSCSSDERLKHNITSLGSTTLEQIMDLNPVTYNWNTEATSTENHHTGFIAQMVQKIFPDLVSTDGSGYLTLNYAGFVPYIVSAIQELYHTVQHFADEFTTKKLCVADDSGEKTCITKAQLDALLQQAGQTAAAANSAGASGGGGSGTTSDTSSGTTSSDTTTPATDTSATSTNPTP